MLAKVNPIKTCALIAGAGAVENAWSPIIKAIEGGLDFPLTADGANSFLARIVYLLRWYSLSPAVSRNMLDFHLNELQRIKSNLIREIKKAEKSGSIKARESLTTLLDKLLIPFCRRFLLVTTNWDTVVPKAMFKHMNREFEMQFTPVHVHGSVAKLSTMYLPSEVTKEPYREKKHDMAIGQMHGAVIRGLEEAHRVILYGLSLDPLDAELGQTLAAGWSNPNLQEILIVDPNHSLIAHRVNLLIDIRRDVRVLGLNPATMDQEEEYTIWRHAKQTLTPIP